jgi:hypothetical protein
MNVEVERVDGSKTQEKSRYGGRDAAELLGLGSISKQIVANRTPLANPSAMDMKRLVGLRQSARSPPHRGGDRRRADYGHDLEEVSRHELVSSGLNAIPRVHHYVLDCRQISALCRDRTLANPADLAAGL